MELDRRGVLALGGAAVAAAPALGALPAGRGSAVLIFDPASVEARALAAPAKGYRLVALTGDPVRLWRDGLAEHRGPVAGLTRWSDYLVLRGLAEEGGLRLRSEERVATGRGPLLVRWQMG